MKKESAFQIMLLYDSYRKHFTFPTKNHLTDINNQTRYFTYIHYAYNTHLATWKQRLIQTWDCSSTTVIHKFWSVNYFLDP